jgi:hypothetical protein
MSVQVGSVAVGIQVDVRNAVNNLRRAEKQLDQLAAGAQGSVKTINKFNKSLNALGVAAGAASFAVIKLGRSSFRAAADVSEMSVAMEAVNKSLKLPPGRINKTANEIRGMGIEMKAAQEMSLLFAQGNLDMAKASQVARVAQDLAVLSQSNSTQTAKTLAYAIQTGNSRLLKSAGITKYAGEAYAEFAATLGKTEAQLTATERQTAVMNMILEEGAKVAGTYEAAMTEPGKVLRSFPRLLNDMQIEFGNVLKEGFGPAIKAGYDLTKAFSKTVREGGALHPILTDLGEAFGDMMEPLTEFLKDSTESVKQLNRLGISVEGVGAKFTKFAPTIAAVNTGLALFAGRNILAAMPVLNRFSGLLGGPVLSSMVVFAATNSEAREAVKNLMDAALPLMESLAAVMQIVAQAAVPIINGFASVLAAVTSLNGGAEILGTALLVLIARKKLLASVTGQQLVTALKTAVTNFRYMRAQIASANATFGASATGVRAYGAVVASSMRAAAVAVKGFIISMGPIAAVTLAVSALVKVFSDWSEKQRRLKERMDDLTDSIIKNTEALRENLAEGERAASGEEILEQALRGTEEQSLKLTQAFRNLKGEADFETLAHAASDMREFAREQLLAAGASEQLAREASLMVERIDDLGVLKTTLDTLTGFDAESRKSAGAIDKVAESLFSVKTALEGADLGTAVNEALLRLQETGQVSSVMMAEAESRVTRLHLANIEFMSDQERQVALYLALTDVMAEHQARLDDLIEKYSDFANGPLPLTQEEMEKVNDNMRKFIRTSTTLTGDIEQVESRMDSFFHTLERPTVEDFTDILLGADAAAARLNETMFNLTKSANKLMEKTANLDGSMTELFDAGYQLFNQFMDIGFQMEMLGRSTLEAQGYQAALVTAFYQSAEAAGYSEEAIVALMEQLHILDGLDPNILIGIGLDTSELERQIMQISVSLTQAERDFGRDGIGGAMVEQLQGQLDALRAIASATRGTAATGGAGTGITAGIREVKDESDAAAKAAEELQKRINDLAQSIAGYGGGLVGEGFAERLLGMHPDDMAEAFNEIALKALDFYDIAKELELPGGDEFIRQIGAFGDRFDELAEAQREVIRLQREFNREVDVYRELNGELDRITAQYRQFRDEVDGSNTPLERVADALKAFKEARTDLDRLNSSYDKFMYQEGLRESTLGERIDEEIKTYRQLQSELDATQREQENFRQGIVDMMAPTVAGAAGRGGVLGNLNNILTQAKTFRDNLAELRTRGFPTDVIQQVIGAGLGTGSKIARRLLAMSTGDYAEFLALREQISAIGAETAQVAGEIVFGSETADAEGRLQEQLGVVQSLYQQAIQQANNTLAAQQRAAEVAYQNAMADAQAKVDAQRLIVESLEESLAGASSYMESLVSAIQTDLRIAFDTFLGGLGGEITRLLDSMAARLERFQSIAQAAESAASRAMSAAAAANAQAQAAKVAAKYGSGGGADPLGGKFTARARGGPLRAGQLSLVGERGPELFVPNQGGTVIPNNRLGGSTVNYNINVRAVGDPAEAGRQIVKQIQEYERRNGSRWRS